MCGGRCWTTVRTLMLCYCDPRGWSGLSIMARTGPVVRFRISCHRWLVAVQLQDSFLMARHACLVSVNGRTPELHQAMVIMSKHPDSQARSNEGLIFW